MSISQNVVQVLVILMVRYHTIKSFYAESSDLQGITMLVIYGQYII